MTVVAMVSADATLRQKMTRVLRANDFVTVEAVSGLEALRIVFDHRPDAAIVDLGITDMNGTELIRVMRAAADLAILALVTNGQVAKSVQALEAGADDATRLGMPEAELMARLRAALRRSQRRSGTAIGPANEHVVQTGTILIDREAQMVTKRGVHVPLTRTEYRLLDALADRIGQAVPHRALLASVWGDEYADDTHYLRIYVGYLRAKLEDDPTTPRYLISEWSVGYRLAKLPAPYARIPEIDTASEAEAPELSDLTEASPDAE